MTESKSMDWFLYDRDLGRVRVSYFHQNFYLRCLTGFWKQLGITHQSKQQCIYLTMNSLVPDSSFHMNVFDDTGKWNRFGLSEHGLIYKPVLVKYKANFTSNIWDEFPLLMLGSPLKHIWKLQQLVESPYHT